MDTTVDRMRGIQGHMGIKRVRRGEIMTEVMPRREAHPE